MWTMTGKASGRPLYEGQTLMNQHPHARILSVPRQCIAFQTRTIIAWSWESWTNDMFRRWNLDRPDKAGLRLVADVVSEQTDWTPVLGANTSDG